MSTLLAMIFSMTVLGGCSPSNTNSGSTVPVGLYNNTTACGQESQISRPEQSHPEAAPPATVASPRRSSLKRRPSGKSLKRWVPERVPLPRYLNNRPYGRR